MILTFFDRASQAAYKAQRQAGREAQQLRDARLEWRQAKHAEREAKARGHTQAQHHAHRWVCRAAENVIRLEIGR